MEKTETKGKVIEVQLYRLKTIMEMLGHEKIDILKMDIEGAEYDVIKDIFCSNIEIGQILVEFHHFFGNVGIEKTMDAITLLNENGFKLFDVSWTGREYSFIKAH